MTTTRQDSALPAPSHAQSFPWHVLVVPGIAALGVVALRVFLHYGEWQALPAYAALLVICGIGAVISAAVAAVASPEGRRLVRFLGWFTAQATVAWGLICALWWMLPLGFAGP